MRLCFVLLAQFFASYVGLCQYSIPFPNQCLKPDSQKPIPIEHICVESSCMPFASELQIMQVAYRAKSCSFIYHNKCDKGLALRAELSSESSEEAYHLALDSNGIFVRGSRTGFFYALQTLLQAMYFQEGGMFISAQEINDFPQYSWRGLHLDVSRHFFPPAYIKQYLFQMAQLKLNVFHWHLTDDQGWRFESQKYPLLNQISSKRAKSLKGAYDDQVFDNKEVKGLYTQQEIREIVSFADSLHIRIVPEIEMPGHARGALAAYPELSCSKKRLPTAEKWGVFEEVFCAGSDSVFLFLEGVLDEVCSLFPGSYIHIGGDECPKNEWKKCAACQRRMKIENLKDEHELQSYFIQRMERFLASRGKKTIGWDEILEGGLAPNAAVMSWRGTNGAIEATKAGHQAVLTPGSHCYFDHYQGQADFEPVAIGGFTTVHKVYQFSPIAGIPKDNQHLILGAQGNVWTEYIINENQVNYAVWSRAAALAEALWTQENSKDLKRFLSHHTLLSADWIANGIDVSQSHLRPLFDTKRINGQQWLELKIPPGATSTMQWIQKGRLAKTDTLFGDTSIDYSIVKVPILGTKLFFQYGPKLSYTDTLSLLPSAIPLDSCTLVSKNTEWAQKASLLNDAQIDFNGSNRYKYAYVGKKEKIVLCWNQATSVEKLFLSFKVNPDAGYELPKEIKLKTNLKKSKAKTIIQSTTENNRIIEIPIGKNISKITLRIKPNPKAKRPYVLMDEIQIL